MTSTGQHPAPHVPLSSPAPGEPTDPRPQALGSAAPSVRTLVVLGASRGTGARLTELARTAGHRVRAVSRTGTSPVDGVEARTADARDPAALRPALRGADAVAVMVGAPGRDRSGIRAAVTRSAIAAMEEEGVRRLVVLSSLGIGDSAHRLGPLTRLLVFPLLLPGAVADHTAQEQAVTASGLDWTILRPGYLGDGDRDPRFAAVAGADPTRLAARAAREDVAAFALSAIEDPGTVGRAYVLGSRR